MAKICPILLICLQYHAAYAQQSFNLSGKVTDTAGTALSHATIRLVAGKDTLNTQTGDGGLFSINNLTTRKFRLWVTMKGFRSYEKSFSVNKDNRSTQLEPITLQTNYDELDPVTITRVRPITIGEDTISYHAAAFLIRDGSAVEDLLKKLPGIEVDANGNVIAQGKKIGRVMVDGKDFFGGDVLKATRNLPANILDMIQVVDDYGDKARLTGVKSGEAQKVLNIVLKKDKRQGQFGQAEVGLGNHGKYLAHAFANSFKEERQLSIEGGLINNSVAGRSLSKNLGVNYADRWNKRWEGNGNVSISGSDQARAGSTIQDNFFSNSQFHQEQRNQSSSSGEGANIDFTLTHRVDTNSLLRINPSLSIERNTQDAISLFSTREEDSGFVKTTSGNSQNKGKGHAINTRLNGYFERTFPHSRRRLSISAWFNYSGNKPYNDNLSSTTTSANGSNGAILQHYLVSNTNFLWSGEATINYYAPLWNSSFLELMYDWRPNRTENRKLTQQMDSSHPNPVYVDSLSNNYQFQSVTQRLHVGYMSHAKKLDITLSLDAQPGSIEGQTVGKGNLQSYRYFNMLPSAQFNYSLTRERKLSFNYNSSISPPGLQQLQPVEDLSNPQYPVTGNPALKPSLNESYNLNYEQSSLQPTQYTGFGLGMGYNTTQHMIITNLVHPHDTSSVVQQTTFLNANGMNSLYGNFHISFPPFWGKRIRVTTDGSISNSHTISMVDSVLNRANSLNWGEGMHVSMNIPNRLDVDFSANYNHTSTRYQSGNNLPSQSSSASWSMTNRHTFFRQWIVNYSLSQSYTSGPGGILRSNPAMLNASMQWQFMRNNKATLSMVVYDLLNGNSGANQSVTPTSVTINRTELTGRYFFCTFLLKLSRFEK